MLLVVVLSIAASICLIVLLLGCLDCLFKKRFQNAAVNSHQAQLNEAYSVDMSDASPSLETVTIEPLPDILPKASTAPPLKPRIVCTERAKQEATQSLISTQRSFPRQNVTYVNELGSGWFGKVIESEATNIIADYATSSVIVKMLKDDASKLEQKQFMEEVSAFRCLDHPNLLSLLGQCIETSPYLIILENAPYGTLKTFLEENEHDEDNMFKKNQMVSFSLDVAAGLACLHRHDYIHNDLAARNCLVMADYTVKIGDYGISDTLFKNEYFNTGRELLPIRWMAPETLVQVQGVWTSQPGDKASDIWSFGILLWEIWSFGDRPYNMLTDEAVLQGVVLDKLVVPSEIDIRLPYKNKMWSIMNECWQEPSERVNIETTYQALEQLNHFIVEDTLDIASDFEQKWNQLAPNPSWISSTGSDLGSRIALAGSFATDNSSSPSDRAILIDGDTGVDVVLDMEGNDVAIHEINEFPSLKSPSTKEGASYSRANDFTMEDSEFTLIQHNVTSSILHDQTIQENTSVSFSHLTPVKPSRHLAMTTSTPVFQGEPPASQILASSSTSSSGNTYITATETLPNPLGDNFKQPSSLEKDVSLDSELSFQELTDNSLHETLGENVNMNNTEKDANRTPTQDYFSVVEDEDFSDFVRTSPVAPSTDFTNFESAIATTNATAEMETNKQDLKTFGMVSAAEDNVSHSSTSEFEFVFSTSADAGPERDKTDYTAFVTSPSAHTETVIESGCKHFQDLSLDIESTSLSIQDTADKGNSKNPTVLAQDGHENAEVFQAAENKSETTFTMENSGQDVISLGSDLEAVSLDSSNLDVISLKSGQDIESLLKIHPVTASTTTASSLSDSLMFSLENHPGAPPTRSSPVRPYSDLQEHPADLSGPHPDHANVAEEKNRAHLLNAMTGLSGPFTTGSTLEFSSDLIPPSDQGRQVNDEKIAAGHEKVGIHKKNESESAESGISSHCLTESLPNSAARNEETDSSSISLTDEYVNSNKNNLSSGSFNAHTSQDEFKLTDLTPIHMSSLYRCNNIHLTQSAVNTMDGLSHVRLSQDQFIDGQENPSTDIISPGESDSESSSTSGQEYVCSGQSDTGQPPPLPTDTSWSENSLHADFDEHALQLASEIYLSRGLKSPRAYEIPPLETIQEDFNQTPSDSSSLEVKYDDLFGSDGYEWDDFYGDSLVSSKHQQQLPVPHQQSRVRELDISDWSLELETVSVPNSSCLLSRLSDESPLNSCIQSEQLWSLHGDVDTLIDSRQNKHCLSDSELCIPSLTQTSKQTLVSSLLSQFPSSAVPVATSSASSNFYSLIEQEELETEEVTLSPITGKSSTTESFIFPSISTSLPASSSPVTHRPPSLVDANSCQIMGVPNDLDFAVSLEPSMSSVLSCPVQESDLQSMKSSMDVRTSEDNSDEGQSAGGHWKPEDSPELQPEDTLEGQTKTGDSDSLASFDLLGGLGTGNSSSVSSDNVQHEDLSQAQTNSLAELYLSSDIQVPASLEREIKDQQDIGLDQASKDSLIEF